MPLSGAVILGEVHPIPPPEKTLSPSVRPCPPSRCVVVPSRRAPVPGLRPRSCWSAWPPFRVRFWSGVRPFLSGLCPCFVRLLCGTLGLCWVGWGVLGSGAVPFSARFAARGCSCGSFSGCSVLALGSAVRLLVRFVSCLRRRGLGRRVLVVRVRPIRACCAGSGPGPGRWPPCRRRGSPLRASCALPVRRLGRGAAPVPGCWCRVRCRGRSVLVCASGGVAVVSFAPAPVARSGFRAGSLVSVLLRPSSRSRSGAVLVCSFRSAPRAARFARRWAGRVGVSVACRRSPVGFSVSVPVSLRSSRWPSCAGLALWSRGGVRGFARLLRSSGLGVARA